MSERSKDGLLNRLESSLEQLQHAVGTVGDNRAASPPTTGGWSVVQIIEHLSIVETRALNRIRTAEPGVGDPNRDAELVAFATDRTSKRQAPEVLHPAGNFSSLRPAWADVEQKRSETIAFCRAHSLTELGGLVSRHPIFGTLDVYQLALSLAVHMERHTTQIQEVTQSLGLTHAAGNN